MEEEMYNKSSRMRLAERMVPRHARADYEAEAAIHSPSSRRQPREREAPRPSVLAGLTGEGRGMNRVFEWRDHVAPGDPDTVTVVAE